MDNLTRTDHRKEISILLSSFRGGGMENKTLLLAEQLVSQGVKVHLITINNHQQAYQPSPSLHVTDLNSSKIILALPKFITYLKQNKPERLLAISGPLNIFAIMARWISGYPKVLMLSERNHLSSAAKLWVKRVDSFRPFLARWLYKYADKVFCVSDAVRADLTRITGLPENKVVFQPNMFDLRGLRSLSVENAAIPPEIPLDRKTIVSIGRFSRQKDLATLIKAYTLLRQHIDHTLVLVGTGPKATELKVLAYNSKNKEDIFFTGFLNNPYPLLALADVFVLPSLYEGLPGVLIEALALGRTCVATDCPGGVREILKDGKYGYLTPVGDADAMASTILRAIREPLSPEECEQGAAVYSIENNIDLVMEQLFGEGN